MSLVPWAGAPGEASDPTDSAPLRAAWNAAAARVDLTYAPACDATDHTVYWGDLGLVSSYTWSGAACFGGTSGAIGFDPGPGSVFFVVVGNYGASEGSYGRSAAGVERPEAAGLPACDYVQDVGGVTCE